MSGIGFGGYWGFWDVLGVIDAVLEVVLGYQGVSLG